MRDIVYAQSLPHFIDRFLEKMRHCNHHIMSAATGHSSALDTFPFLINKGNVEVLQEISSSDYWKMRYVPDPLDGTIDRNRNSR